MATATELITGSLRFINAYEAGESIASDDLNDALTMLNDLLESMSTDQASVYASSENLFTFTPGKYQYTIGNYTGGTFTGTLVSGSAVISGVTVPSTLVALGDVTCDTVGALPSGVTVVSFNAGAGTVTLSANALLTIATPIVFTYTIPGDFKMPRPLRITESFTRITTSQSSLDYPIQMIDQERYVSIGFKGISAPWPIMCWYNPTMPLGNLYFYQNPSSASELHLFTDNILTSFPDTTTNINLPQGYSRCLKKLLARELAPEYGRPWGEDRERQANQAYAMIKSLNQDPTPISRFDDTLLRPGGRDAGWILHGGFASTNG